MNNIQLSIIVPIYYVEEYLEECLTSIYALEDMTYEVILVNDGSPDNCSAIIERFNQQYASNTVVINQKNAGLSAARNSGLCVAKGKYVALVDSDDYIASKVLFTLYQYALNEDLDIAFAQSLTFWKGSGAQTKTLTIPSAVTNLEVTNGLNILETSFQAGYKRINCWNKIYKRDFLQANNLIFVEGIFFEDVPFTFQAFFVASRVKAFALDYYYYRQRPGSIMTSKNQKSDPSRITIINNVLHLFSKHSYSGNSFDDYLIYQLWENACGTGNRHTKLCITFIKRHKVSSRGAVRLLFILMGLAKLMPA
jgi:glycosyltransferase involved in cell wall biosynthesis